MRAGKQLGCSDDLEFGGFYTEQKESWSGVSSHYVFVCDVLSQHIGTWETAM